jgi:hypothetical protein
MIVEEATDPFLADQQVPCRHCSPGSFAAKNEGVHKNTCHFVCAHIATVTYTRRQRLRWLGEHVDVRHQGRDVFLLRISLLLQPTLLFSLVHAFFFHCHAFPLPEWSRVGTTLADRSE